MSTLPRINKSTLTPPRISPATLSIARPPSEFDAGINTSHAWAEHLDREASLSDEDTPRGDVGGEVDALSVRGRSARAVYDFTGMQEFQELSVCAGDALAVLKEHLADGWSLVRHRGEVGLVPRTYYIFTSDFAAAPDVDAERSRTLTREASGESTASPGSGGSLTPRNSPPPSGPDDILSPEEQQQQQPLIPQTTGEWLRSLPSFRRSLLGGKSLNRFSSFVTTGAEEWILRGSTQPPSTSTHPNTENLHSRISSELSTPGDTTITEDDLGKRLSRIGISEADLHFVDAGPAWKPKVPPFRVLVHSPSKRASSLTGAYTVYAVTSLFYPPSPSSEPSDFESSAEEAGVGGDSYIHQNENTNDDDGTHQIHVHDTLPPSPTRLTVHRRFSHFVFLHSALTRRLPGLALPPLPEKQYSGRFSSAFVEARRGDLQRYLNKLVRHPVARYAEVVMFFLGCESDVEWKRQLPHHLSTPPAGPSFYARVYHPAFNLDVDDAAETVDRFETHTKAVGRGVQQLRGVFGKIRQARVEMSNAERLLSYSLLSLITSTPLATSSTITEEEEEEDSDGSGSNDSGSQRNGYQNAKSGASGSGSGMKKTRGLMNGDGAWCWREDCSECLHLSKALQKTSETLQGVADLYDDHARRTLLASHEALKDVVHPATLYAPIIETHRETLARYREATDPTTADDEMAGRCETVLNTTMAEFETYHVQKCEDFGRLAREHLDDEIAFYEKILKRLHTARRTYTPSSNSNHHPYLPDGPRTPSLYERDLAAPRLTAPPLPQPCAHVFDSAPLRPVSAAIQGGVGMLLGGGGGGGGGPRGTGNAVSGRGSVFGRFW
ncbi:hypothetical protein BD410DRAFT_765795 [Rickenella mellea]|uniref:PX-domain-containing protein n=1 Tax=Rickenella mellea TaxID=50990 RepID=A0A4Y7QCN9_9AGAM|nr:hypothetical protein BD410DRAFT_765795 [Rickenella mellea]